ncbi:hypothetical protein [Pseudomonas serbica]|uniref:hypothetical protein n=1 Tax=Pseudomonas serbica TaxID=2965074 RepID=UPI0039E36D39
MEPILIFMTYRILIVLGGILSIYFGYKLFYIVKLKQGEFKIKTGQNYELSLSDVAPGVFFALFGASILIFCLTNGVTIKPIVADVKTIEKLSADPKTSASMEEMKRYIDSHMNDSKVCVSQRYGEC